MGMGDTALKTLVYVGTVRYGEKSSVLPGISCTCRSCTKPIYEVVIFGMRPVGYKALAVRHYMSRS